MVTAARPPTIMEAIDLSVTLTEEALRMGKFSKSGTNKKETHVESSGDNKRKFSNLKKGTQESHDNPNANKRREANPPRGMKAYGATIKDNGKAYMGTMPRCDECKFHHEGRCLRPKYDRCGKEGTTRIPVGQDIPAKEEMVTTTSSGTIMVESQAALTAETWGISGRISLKETKPGEELSRLEHVRHAKTRTLLRVRSL